MTALISASRSSHFRSFTQPRLMTMSTSSAPLSTASEAMKHLAAVVSYPLGKPMTVQMGSLPAAYSAARLT